MTKASRFVHNAPLRPRAGITWGNVPEETIDAKEHPLKHIHTISAYETSEEEFFKRLVDWKVDLVVDTRLKNTNQPVSYTHLTAKRIRCPSSSRTGSTSSA